MLTKITAKEAAILMCARRDIDVIKIGRWHKSPENLLKRLFTCKFHKDYDIGIEVVYDYINNIVSISDWVNDQILSDYKPGRSEYDDEISFRLVDKGFSSSINALEEITVDDALKISINIIRNYGVKITCMGHWVDYPNGFWRLIYTKKADKDYEFFVKIRKDQILVIENLRKNIHLEFILGGKND